MARILLGKGEDLVYLHSQYGNRHGLVAGATGYRQDRLADGAG